MRKSLLLVLLVVGWAAGACGPSHNGGSACDQTPVPAGCGQACDPSQGNTCPTGFHCTSDDTCNADCGQGTDCPAGQVCTSDGFCVSTDGGPPPIDADCPAVHFTPAQIIPSIELLIDGSGSMNMSDISPTRFGAIVNGLVGNTQGVVNALQAKVYFGSAIFTDANPCPTLLTVPRALNNAQAISDSISPFTPTGRTPTAPSIDDVVTDFANNPPPNGSPPIILLATDGEPNSCTSSTANTGPSITAAHNAYLAGIHLYILGLAGLNTQFLQDMANAGLGVQPGQPNAPYFTANDPTSLQTALQQIIGGVLSCDLTISGTIDASQASQGTVTLNGVTLQYGVDWILLPDGMTIELIGGACDTLKSSANPVVDASFPCGVIIP